MQAGGHDLGARSCRQITKGHVYDAARRLSQTDDEIAEIFIGCDKHATIFIGARQDLIVFLRRTDVDHRDNVETVCTQAFDDGTGDAFIGEQAHCYFAGKTDSRER